MCSPPFLRYFGFPMVQARRGVSPRARALAASRILASCALSQCLLSACASVSSLRMCSFRRALRCALVSEGCASPFCLRIFLSSRACSISCWETLGRSAREGPLCGKQHPAIYLYHRWLLTEQIQVSLKPLKSYHAKAFNAKPVKDSPSILPESCRATVH